MPNVRPRGVAAVARRHVLSAPFRAVAKTIDLEPANVTAEHSRMIDVNDQRLLISAAPDASIYLTSFPAAPYPSLVRPLSRARWRTAD